MMLIINCDDFGLSQGVNSAVLEAFREGIISSTTLMVNQSHTHDALRLWRENIDLMSVGLHFCLDSGKPLSMGWEDYTDENGYFKRPHRNHIPDLPEDLIQRELQAQIERAQSLGGRITHIDSHHHIHIFYPNVAAVVDRVSASLGLPVRSRDILMGDFYGDNVSREFLESYLLDNLHRKRGELMCHIAHRDEDLSEKTSYYSKRMVEFSLLKSLAESDFYSSHGIELSSYDSFK